jgi:hypothetical protein
MSMNKKLAALKENVAAQVHAASPNHLLSFGRRLNGSSYFSRTDRQLYVTSGAI